MRELIGVNDERVKVTEYGKGIENLVFISAALLTLLHVLTFFNKTVLNFLRLL